MTWKGARRDLVLLGLALQHRGHRHVRSEGADHLTHRAEFGRMFAAPPSRDPIFEECLRDLRETFALTCEPPAGRLTPPGEGRRTALAVVSGGETRSCG